MYDTGLKVRPTVWQDQPVSLIRPYSNRPWLKIRSSGHAYLAHLTCPTQSKLVQIIKNYRETPLIKKIVRPRCILQTQISSKFANRPLLVSLRPIRVDTSSIHCLSQTRQVKLEAILTQTLLDSTRTLSPRQSSHMELP